MKLLNKRTEYVKLGTGFLLIHSILIGIIIFYKKYKAVKLLFTYYGKLLSKDGRIMLADRLFESEEDYKQQTD
jgi:hypothetical protein